MFALGLATGAVIVAGYALILNYTFDKLIEKLEKKEGEK